ASSPAAAAETLRNRAKVAETASAEEADAVGRELVLDLGDEDDAETLAVTPGADVDEDAGGDGSGLRRRLLDMARQADVLRGDADTKLIRLVDILGELV